MSNWQQTVRDAAPYMSLGMQLGLGMAGCVAVGFLLDRYLATEPWGVLAGALLGVASMIARVMYIARQQST
ncbi:MAG: AtpZ/AtpI family protein [Bacteroidota bacterium]|nr:AtpZ/AtpI family protein [Bacteroidota bacterium]MDE2834679.1 AtpZ/AtpI family protein [Bacteroidota bacterium]MDE2955493.1 AtpZ/AtpI family protein [Bacteroidota bacterium]